MSKRPLRAIAMVLITLAGAACGTGAPSAARPLSPSSTLSPTPASEAAAYAESMAAVCAAFGSLLRAVGNPDAGTPSVLSKALDDAVTAGDAAAANKSAASILTELETGRQQAAVAGRWEPARPAAVAMNTLLLAFGAMVAAKQAKAAETPGAVDPQVAFEQAGGVDAWTSMLLGIRATPLPPGASPAPCKAFSGTP